MRVVRGLHVGDNPALASCVVGDEAGAQDQSYEITPLVLGRSVGPSPGFPRSTPRPTVAHRPFEGEDQVFHLGEFVCVARDTSPKLAARPPLRPLAVLEDLADRVVAGDAAHPSA